MAGISRKEHAEQTEAALKDAALRLFAERGYLGTRITDITAAAGRAAGSFYNHFAGKEELLEAMLRDLSAAGDDAVLATGSGHDPDFTRPSAVRWHVAAAWRFFRDHAALLRAVEQAAQVNEGFGRRVEEFRETEQADAADHLAHITAAGMRLPADPAASLSMMYGLLHSMAERWLPADGPPPPGAPTEDEAIDALSTFIYRGLTGRDP